MVESDARDYWHPELLTDARVTHYWDGSRVVGAWFAPRTESADMKAALAPNSTGLGQRILWDTFLVYGSESHWDEAPSHLRRWGRTILATRESLIQSIDSLAAVARNQIFQEDGE